MASTLPASRTRPRRAGHAALLGSLCALAACGTEAPVELSSPDCTDLYDAEAKPDASGSSLRFSELVSDNDGVAVDEVGQTDDLIELYNGGSKPIALNQHWLADDSGALIRLPQRTIKAGEVIVLWADEEFDQGQAHLPFKLSSKGDRVTLIGPSCRAVDRVELPKLDVNEVFARIPQDSDELTRCRYGSVGKPNGDQCEPPAPPELHDDITFEPYSWPEGWDAPEGPLVITELRLSPEPFAEVHNQSDDAIDLRDYTLQLSAVGPAQPLPAPDMGSITSFPIDAIAAGERVVVPLDADAAALLLATPEGEGVVSVLDADGSAIDRVDFMHVPEGAALARIPDDAGQLTLCASASPGEPTEDCEQLESRELGDRVHALRTPGDFRGLAAGGTEVGLEAVKFVIDMAHDDTVHLLGSDRWALHYTFIRERIYGDPVLDRCDAAQNAEFNAGWVAFSQTEYFQTEGRRFLLGTLVEHANGMHTVEFTAGDAISGAQMRRAFFAVVAYTDQPQQWVMRAADARQVAEARKVEGTLPIVGPDAPFENLRYQPLTPAVGFGELRFVPADELLTAELGPRIIVVTDDVPNDLPLVGGLVTEAFQTPLAHVNVLSQARGTPNMALRDARTDERIAPLLGKLVRLEVRLADVDVREATPEEADAFWEQQRPETELVVPEVDRETRGIRELPDASREDLPAIGAKAAQFAELYRVEVFKQGCPASTIPLLVPEDAFAIPVAHYFDHFEASGARELVNNLLEDPQFRADPKEHERGLAAVRQSMLSHPVDPDFLSEVTAAVNDRFGHQRVRFRSSSNVEDLPTFNGAGLHTSISVEIGDKDRSVQDGLRTVWSSLWNTRAFDERDYANIDPHNAAMAVLVHEAHLGEAAQGVAISRNLLDLTRLNSYFINAQVGEGSVTNPAPGVTTEQLLYTFPPRAPELAYLSPSSLVPEDERVLSLQEARNLACALGSVHLHFRNLLDPKRENKLFAMQIEWKLDQARKVVVKQARPQPFGNAELPKDCREYF